MSVRLTYDVLAKMFRCPDCRPAVPINLFVLPNDVQKVRVNHVSGCPQIDRFADTNIYMPIEVADDDPVLKRLDGKDDL